MRKGFCTGESNLHFYGVFLIHSAGLSFYHPDIAEVTWRQIIMTRSFLMEKHLETSLIAAVRRFLYRQLIL